MLGAVIGAATRLKRVRGLLDAHELDAILLSRSANKRWLAGFILQRGEESTSGYAGTLLVTRPDLQAQIENFRNQMRKVSGNPG